MRITKVKLAGFKSFVDPTTLTLPGNLTAIVGPNGCGKSNIIDAVMWVMGESSAKHLRGDSMADVIFTGSNSRKPVGQASVELVFDNSDGKLGGQYAGYGEIAIKRTVSRDGISSYFLNSTRCRRKDITNVFLGTGLGVRGSYSVIEQGMISRVVEAKPEELRGFLEEAAGISKYKERRRETEHRIRHTNENIERLNDIREELEKQLTHLQRQAKAADRYQKLKEEERLMEAQILGLRWLSIDSKRSAHKAVVAQHENSVEAVMTQLRRIEKLQTESHEARTRAGDEFNKVQSDFYAKSAEISRLEQTIKHVQERREALQADLDSARRRTEEAARLVNEDSRTLRGLADAISELEPRFARAEREEHAAAEELRDAEQRAQAWQSDWDTFNQHFSEAARLEHVEQVRLEHLEDGYAGSRDRLSVLTREYQSLGAVQDDQKIAEARGALTEREREHDQLLVRRDAVRRDLQQARRLNQNISEQLHRDRSVLETAKGKLASVKALQEAALGQDREQREVWLQRNGLGSYPLLAEEIAIEAGWERAVEVAMRIPLGALCGDALVDALLGCDRADRPAEPVTVVARGPAPVGRTTLDDVPALLDKVSSPWPLDSLLAGVYAAETLHDAEQIRSRLGADESVVTRDGLWIGPNWAQLQGPAGAQSGILERERVLGDLANEAAALESTVARFGAEYEDSDRSLQRLESEEHELAQSVQAAADAVTEAKTELSRCEAERERNAERAAEIKTEIDDLEYLSEENASAIETARASLTGMQGKLVEFDEERNRLSTARQRIHDELNAARATWRDTRQTSHDIALELERTRSNHQSLVTAVERNEQLKHQLAGHCTDLETAMISAQAPKEDAQTKLEETLAERLSLETALREARGKLEEIEAGVRANEEERIATENQIAERRNTLEEARLEGRTLEVRANEIEDRLRSTEYEVKVLVEALPEEATEESWQERLEKVRSRINRLGPINLAAIEEFTQLSERKQYLDRQLEDLTEALATLRNAIHAIDRETRTRFKETFDKVSDGLKATFPILFGGGHAYLEMTGDDLLETGVTVMARPPGKRNSTIHLLSGGEKALTAVAFIFAIFELNPAPFCLLDEVDAPLDDANVVRLSDMLMSMSERIQFICITHNKITMEIAAQLIGVTMQEAGVSRLVSVNMEEAVEMAAAG
jgi:chromosome segregation protein